jgi:hypothetical protein
MANQIQRARTHQDWGGPEAVDPTTGVPSIYNCCGLFDLCGDADLMSLSFEGAVPFLDWLTWQPTLVCEIVRNFITWVRPERANGVASPGWICNPCDDPYGTQWGSCGFKLDHFGRLRRSGPVREAPRSKMILCENQPRYRLDGQMIVDDLEFDMRLAMEVLMQDLKRMVITGNHATCGQFDGLVQYVKTGYVDPSTGHRCTSMDSFVVNWNGNDMGALPGGHGATLNGQAIPTGTNFVDLLLWLWQAIRTRIGLSPQLASQTLTPGDVVLVMPSWMIRCLLDQYTCWSVCANSINDTYEARTFRNNLNGGMFGYGEIQLDGFRIPLIGYDWGLQSGPTRGDIYMLTGSIGTTRLLNGQYLDMRGAPGAWPEALFNVTDGGRVLQWAERQHTCMQRIVEMQPRILSWAPWAQARIEEVVCHGIGLPIVADPENTSFFPEKSFIPASCPPEEIGNRQAT